jgi:hypothetical protein
MVALTVPSTPVGPKFADQSESDACPKLELVIIEKIIITNIIFFLIM